jgi:DNA-binding transcriptional ArsR family regulator
MMVTRQSSADPIFRALSDPTRRAILGALRGTGMPVGELAQRFPVSRPAISRHLRVLRRARLVTERRDGRLRICELNSEPLRQIDAWLGDYRRFWTGKLARLKQHLESQP